MRGAVVLRLSPAWIPFGVWSKLGDVMRAFAARRLAEAVRQAVYYTAWRLASATGSEVRAWAQEVAQAYLAESPKGWSQLGRMREVGLYLHSTYPLRKIVRELRDALGREVSRSFAVAFAIHVAASARRAELAEPALSLLKAAWREAWRKAPTKAEFAKALVEEMIRRRPLVPKGMLAEWDSLTERAKADPQAVGDLIGERAPSGVKPAVVAPPPGAFRDLLHMARLAAGDDPRRLESEIWLRKDAIMRSARSPEERAAADLLFRLHGEELAKYVADLLK
ncbi:MAG: hypothetical protein QXU93_11620 [Thermoproteus sp.]